MERREQPDFYNYANTIVRTPLTGFSDKNSEGTFIVVTQHLILPLNSNIEHRYDAVCIASYTSKRYCSERIYKIAIFSIRGRGLSIYFLISERIPYRAVLIISFHFVNNYNFIWYFYSVNNAKYVFKIALIALFSMY